MLVEHILVATDLSAPTWRLFSHAAGLAAATGARLTLLHVDELSGSAYRESRALQDYLARLASIRERYFQSVTDAMQRLGLRSVETRVVEGRARRDITAIAEELDVDLIAIGKRAEPDRESFLLGSTTNRVVRTARVPVLVIDPNDPATGPSGISTPTYARIMVATVPTPTDRAVVRLAVDIAQKLGSKVTAVHAMTLPDTGALSPRDLGTSLPTNGEDDVRRAAELALIEHIHAAVGSAPVATHVAVGSMPSATLATAAASVEADLVVISALGRHAGPGVGLGSTAERMLRRSPIPMLVLPSAG